MESARTYTVRRIDDASLGWDLSWNRSANLVAFVGSLPGVQTPLEPGDIIRAVNEALDIDGIIEQLNHGAGPFDIVVERFQAEDIPPPPPPPAAVPRTPRLVYREMRSGTALEGVQLLLTEGAVLNPADIRLKETPRYLGLYFDVIVHPARRLVFAHITIAHWRREVPALREIHKERILQRARSGLQEDRFRFVVESVVDLGHRALIALHVHERQHVMMIALGQMADAFFRSMRCHAVPSWRQNYHLSVDGPAARA